MNSIITNQPIVVLTGAGASKFLGKATTFDIYSAPEFQTRSGTRPFGLLMELRQMMNQDDPNGPIDLESLLDKILEVTTQFDFLARVPEVGEIVNRARDRRDNYEEAREQALDFMIEYYGKIDGTQAANLYQPLLEGLRDLVSAIQGACPVIPLFTLNYDEAVESAVDELDGFDLLDGFLPGYTPLWSKDTFGSFRPPSGSTTVALFKLHGSVSWTQPPETERIERTPRVLRQRTGTKHLVLYPTRLPKVIDEEPFATGYTFLRQTLAAAKVGVFIGTSFRDKELKDAIRERMGGLLPFFVMAVNPAMNEQQVADELGVPRTLVSVASVPFEVNTISAILNDIRSSFARVPLLK